MDLDLGRTAGIFDGEKGADPSPPAGLVEPLKDVVNIRTLDPTIAVLRALVVSDDDIADVLVDEGLDSARPA